jgi:hypothetical protein
MATGSGKDGGPKYWNASTISHIQWSRNRHHCPRRADAERQGVSEDWDRLTELRQQNISLRTEGTPSKVGQSSMFRKEQGKVLIDIGRPYDPNYYPIPISLLHPEVARFQDAMRSAPLDPCLSPLARRFSTELSKLFEHEKEREEEFHELVAELLGNPVAIDNVLFGRCHPDIIPDLPAMPANLKVQNETTEGTLDGAFENSLYYQEGVRHILTSKTSLRP